MYAKAEQAGLIEEVFLSMQGDFRLFHARHMAPISNISTYSDLSMLCCCCRVWALTTLVCLCLPPPTCHTTWTRWVPGAGCWGCTLKLDAEAVL